MYVYINGELGEIKPFSNYVVHRLNSCTYIMVPNSEVVDFFKNEFLKECFLKATNTLVPNFSSHRENGVYFFGSARADLKTIKEADHETQFLKIECCDFCNLLDMEKLEKKIREGEINPKISYDKKRSFWRKLIPGNSRVKK